MLDKIKTVGIAGIALVATGAWKVVTTGGGYALGYGVTRAAFHTAKNTTISSQQEVNEAVRQTGVVVRKDLPFKLDEYTTLVDVKTNGPKITFYYDVLLMKETIPDIPTFEKEMTKSICENTKKLDAKVVEAENLMWPYGYSKTYNYSDSKGEAIASIVIHKDTCRAPDET